jgi:hypothetical protein
LHTRSVGYCWHLSVQCTFAKALKGNAIPAQTTISIYHEDNHRSLNYRSNCCGWHLPSRPHLQCNSHYSFAGYFQLPRHPRLAPSIYGCQAHEPSRSCANSRHTVPHCERIKAPHRRRDIIAIRERFLRRVCVQARTKCLDSRTKRDHEIRG